MNRRQTALGLGLVVLLLGYFAGLFQGRSARLIAQARSLIERYYVDRPAVTAQRLTYGALAGMVDALGDTGHSRFLPPRLVRAMAQQMRNRLQGIGAEVRLKDHQVVIVAPLEDSPALRAGLRSGDVILKVNGRDVAGLPLEQVVDLIAGPPGTPVTLTVLSAATAGTRDVTLTRATVVIHQVTWQALPGTALAHLHIAAFEEGTTRELTNALAAIRQRRLAGVLLDLRDNPGGLLDEAVGCASQFLRGGNVLQVRNARGHCTPIPVRAGGLATNLPLVVLVNGGTASGAEVMAGALQDAGRAPLVGETTFGTGTVLEEFPLADGSALLLAVEEWLTPSGRVFWHRGLTPGTVVSLPAGAVPLFPEAERRLTAAELQAGGDTQLRRALALLSEPLRPPRRLEGQGGNP